MKGVGDDLGPWDVYYPVNTRYPEAYSFIMPMRALWPGIDLPPDSILQLLEDEIMQSEDYAWVSDIARRWRQWAYVAFFMEMIPRIWDHVGHGWRAYAYIMPRLMVQSIGWRR